MLIKALSDYYGVIEKQGKILDDAYSSVGISYLVSLTEDGKVDGIIDCENARQIKKKNRKGEEVIETKKFPRSMILPKRIESTSVNAYIVDHRPAYIFGLTCKNEALTEDSPNDKTRKSHADFVRKNEEFFRDMKEPICRAFYRFVTEWEPEKETGNEKLAAVSKAFNMAGFAFCLSGHPEILLHESAEVKSLWKEKYKKETEMTLSTMKVGFCQVEGKMLPIPEKHDGIKNTGGSKAFPKIVSRKNPSEQSYGQERSVGSGISDVAMKRYTKALGYLLSDRLHTSRVDDLIIVHWAASGNDMCDAGFMAKAGMETWESRSLLTESTEGTKADDIDNSIGTAMRGASQGVRRVNTDAIVNTLGDETFYVVGLKLNDARISVQFVCKDRFGEIIKNVEAHQNDIRMDENSRDVSIEEIKNQTVSPKVKDKKASTLLMGETLKSILNGTGYPSALYTTVLRRIQTDKDVKPRDEYVRIGILKGYINRKNRILGREETITMAMDEGNTRPPYLCGRLFAVLENIQYQASDTKLNKTIKDTYFSMASRTPGRCFPKLIDLSNHHISKKKLTAAEAERNNILNMFGQNGDYSFPQRLSVEEQGEFIIGYAQQKAAIFERIAKAKQNAEEKADT